MFYYFPVEAYFPHIYPLIYAVEPNFYSLYGLIQQSPAAYISFSPKT